ncbi:hypothetical protein H4S02_006118 [Coemansia sp. RSA 2611]|nr:hypothetical protein IWW54_005647 [Coemansia sp. RSA 2705]KAJ2362610.1 hypothetical protein H4S01_004701 [Coemansia sp. RSA 2610]KAJ2381651.1 hypothetical protein H4S02_006118 [Coemansia sp. RSA 2611]
MPFCRHTTEQPTPAATWTVGEPVTIKFNPDNAIHSGGSCQFSISYSDPKESAVVFEMLRYCFLGSKPDGVTNTAKITEYTFTLPKELPNSDSATFMWTYINASGNREIYQNCARVKITGSTSSSYTGKATTIANYPGYPTIPEFNGDYDTGIDLYMNAPNITISPSGSTGGGSTNSPPNAPSDGASGGSAGDSSGNSSAAEDYSASSAPVPSSMAPDYSAPAASSDAPAYSAPAADTASAAETASAAAPDYNTDTSAAAPNAHDAEDSVSAGGSSGGSCTAGQMQCSGTGYQICAGGQWSTTYSCGTGTTCKGTGGGIYCDFA